MGRLWLVPRVKEKMERETNMERAEEQLLYAAMSEYMLG
jgi:hypothetical protein